MQALLLALGGLGLAVAATYLMGWWPRSTGALHLSGLEQRVVIEGVEVVQARVHRGSHRAGRLVAVFADPRAIDPQLLLNLEQARLRDLDRDALLIANAGYFTEQRRPTGLLVSRGRQLSPFVPEAGAAGSGVLVVEDGQVLLLEREQVGGRRFDEARLAIQAGPRIIEPGGRAGIRSDDGARANRTVLGADRRGRLVVLVVHGPEGGTSTGPTLFELMRLLGPEVLGADRPDLALDFALNLDGGPSTGLSLRTAHGREEFPEINRVLSVLKLDPAP